MVQVYDPVSQKTFEEKVFGGAFIKWAYESTFGRKLSSHPFFQKKISQLWGLWNHSRLSSQKISAFVKNYHINLEDFEGAPYQSFSEFFYRKLKSGHRKFPENKAILGALAEGRLSMTEIKNGEGVFQIKGQKESLSSLCPADFSDEFKNSWAFIFRLCPVDYHRFHFPDDGKVQRSLKVPGRLESVHPLAQANTPQIFTKNEREITYFESVNFGPLLLIEVGAFCVGLIQQTYNPKEFQKKGAEKGYFDFGASTCILIALKSHVTPDKTLLEKFQKDGLESYVQLGYPIAQKNFSES